MNLSYSVLEQCSYLKKIKFGGVFREKWMFYKQKDVNRDPNKANKDFLGAVLKTDLRLKAKIRRNRTRFIEYLIELEGVIFHIIHTYIYKTDQHWRVLWFYRARRLNYPSAWSSAFPPWLVSDLLGLGVPHHFKQNEKCPSGSHGCVRKHSALF